MPVTGISPVSSAVTSAAVAVPDLGGRTREEAQQALEALGLRAAPVLVEAVGPEGRVYAQDPTSPRVLARGATVKLYITKNPAQAPDWSARFTALDEAVAAVQTEEAAKARHEEVLTKLGEIGSAVGSAGTAKSSAPAKQAS